MVAFDRVRGRQGVGAFRGGANSKFLIAGAGGGLQGAAQATRFVVCKLLQAISGTQFPIWNRKRFGFPSGWAIEISSTRTVEAVVGTGGGNVTSTGTTVIDPGRLFTVGLRWNTAEGGTNMRVYLNGVLEDQDALAAYAADGAALMNVGADDNQIATNALRVYCLQGTDSAAISDADMLAHHQAVVDDMEQGRLLTPLPSQERYWEGDDLYNEIDPPTGRPLWRDRTAPLSGDVFIPNRDVLFPEAVFDPCRF